MVNKFRQTRRLSILVFLFKKILSGIRTLKNYGKNAVNYWEYLEGISNKHPNTQNNLHTLLWCDLALNTRLQFGIRTTIRILMLWKEYKAERLILFAGLMPYILTLLSVGLDY
jgi:hypothetical protein